MPKSEYFAFSSFIKAANDKKILLLKEMGVQKEAV